MTENAAAAIPLNKTTTFVNRVSRFPMTASDFFRRGAPRRSNAQIKQEEERKGETPVGSSFQLGCPEFHGTSGHVRVALAKIAVNRRNYQVNAGNSGNYGDYGNALAILELPQLPKSP